MSRSIDPSYRWDGDGPDPVDDGFDAYDVTVTAGAIVSGKLIEGEAFMGGSYYRPDEPTAELGGYLNQMLIEAVDRLAEQAAEHASDTPGHLVQLADARGWLKQQSRDEYEAQRAAQVARARFTVGTE